MTEHQRIGRLAAERADMVIGVGQRARALVEAAIVAGVSEEQTRMYGSSLEAAEALKELLQKGDAVLIKGSQSIRTERIVEALLADPSGLSKLVRQDAEWKRR
jgi:UDP-N-acetylmuramoyl-tripeptide--D-alanyl-D-alanine ligase